MGVVRGKTKCLVNLNTEKRWGQALRDFGLCTPARRESPCEGEHAYRRKSDGQVASSPASEIFL